MPGGAAMRVGLVPMHGIGSRHDLPLPFGFVVTGAAVVVVVTFALALFAWRRPRFSSPGGLALPRLTRLLDHRVVRGVAVALVWGVYAWFALALWGGQDRLINPFFGFVFVLLWVGLVPLSLLFGHVWRDLHPLTALPVRGRVLPGRVGVWPAAAGVVAFAYLELIEPQRATLAVQRIWCTAWWVWMLAGVLVFERRWIAAADPFTAYADLVARLSCWQRVDGVLHLVNPLRHAATEPAPRGTAGLVAALLGATAFDSMSGSLGWIRMVQRSHVAPQLWGLGGLALTTSVVALTLWLGIRAMRGSLRAPVPGLFATMAATCAPIVVGYAVGHYASLLWIEGQRTLINASDPLSLGWNAFGTAELGVSTTVFDYPSVVATTQLVSIVGGHVLGVLTAHERALRLLRPERALRGQLPLLTIMVGYTVAGLLLLFNQ